MKNKAATDAELTEYRLRAERAESEVQDLLGLLRTSHDREQNLERQLQKVQGELLEAKTASKVALIAYGRVSAQVSDVNYNLEGAR